MPLWVLLSRSSYGPLVHRYRLTKQNIMPRHGTLHGLGVGFPEAGATFEIREEESDGSSGKMGGHYWQMRVGISDWRRTQSAVLPKTARITGRDP